MSVLKNLEQTLLKYVKDKLKLGNLSKEQVSEIIRMQTETLNAINLSLTSFDKGQLLQLMEKYKAVAIDKNNRHDVSKYLISLNMQLTGKASAYEKSQPFGAALIASSQFVKILHEINKNIDDVFPKESITIFECKISTVMLLGILREIDIFCRVTTLLWGHFTDVVTGGDTIPLGYRAEYIVKNFEKYIVVLNDIHTKDHNYSFLKDIGDLQKKNSDIILYANNQSFLNFLNPTNLTQSAMHHVTYGIWGFNVFTWIVSLWDDWKHIQYLRNKDFKGWLETRAALLRLELNNTNPNAPEYQRLVKIIKAYDAKIAEYDRKLSDYEKE